MSSVPPAPYAKPWLSVPDQVTLLESRGLQVNDRQAAEAFLYHLNYYRFAGYCLAFENPRHAFPSGVTFDQIVEAYRFDAVLRDLFTEGLELIEIDLRTAIAYYLGDKHGAFGHIEPKNFHNKFDHHTNHAAWLQKLHEETRRSSELFVQHFRRSYVEFPNLPIWAVTEVMSFGGVSRMIRAMHKSDRTVIANQYGIPQVVLSSVTHHFAYVRNLCAHHCRLWDRVWSVKSDLPKHPDWENANTVSNQRVFATLLLMRKLMRRSSHNITEADKWRDRVTELLVAPPAVADASNRLGLSNNWQAHPVWV